NRKQMARAAKQQEEPARRIFPVSIVQQVGDEERTAKLEELRELDEAIDKADAEKKASAVDHNATIKALRASKKAVMNVLGSGVERVDVDAYTVVDHQVGEVRTYRVDNDQLIPERTRPLTSEERQMNIDELYNLPPGEDASND